MGIALKTSPQDLVKGVGFDNIKNAFHYISNGKEQEGLDKLSMTMKELFDINVKFVLTDTSNEYKFFGFRAYPKQMDNFIGSNKIELGKWEDEVNWTIEIDGKVRNDYSSKLLAPDLAYLFIFFIEYNLCNKSLIDRCNMLYNKVFSEDKIDYRVMRMLDLNPVAKITNVIVLQRCHWVNFLTELPNDSILRVDSSAVSGYLMAMDKLIKTYGTSGLVNRKIDEFDREIVGVIEWIYDGVNDLKYSAFRFRKNLAIKISTINSVIVKKILLDIYRSFNNSVTTVFAQESFGPVVKKSKEQIAIERANFDNYYKRMWQDVCESYNLEFIDKNGNAMKADKQEIDEIRVRVANIDSVNDKVFLLERLHKQYAIVDNALAMLEDKKAAHKVKQTKADLLNFKSQLDLIREMIFKAPSGRMRFGLYIQYPSGYEG